MRLTLALPMIMLAGAGAAAVRVQDMVSSPAAAANGETRLSAAIDDELTARQTELARRARNLDLKERLVAVTAARRGRGGPAGVTPPKAAMPAGDVVPNPQLLQVAKVYQAMKPREAAAVFERLDVGLQTQIAAQMRDRSVAGLIAAMDPDAASRLTAALAGQPSEPVRTGEPSRPAPKGAPADPAPTAASPPATLPAGARR